MKSVILACKILEDEILAAMRQTGCQAPVAWLESTLHLYPEKLKAALQEHINNANDADNILLTFGLCGNSVIGLKSDRATLVIPQCNDCIEMLLHPSGTEAPSQDIGRDTKGCYFLTRGWVRDERSLAKEVDHYFSRYGVARAQRILKTMLGQYSYLVVLDTHSYPLEEFIPLAEELAAKLNLEVKVFDASISQLERLFLGDWDDSFCRIPPGVTVGPEHFRKVAATGSLVNTLTGGQSPARAS